MEYFGDEIDAELARSILKRDLVLIARRLYKDLTGDEQGGQGRNRRHGRMSSINRCAEFANQLVRGRADYSQFLKGDNKKKQQANVLIGVRFPRESFPEEFRRQYDEIALLRDVAKIWKSALAQSGEEFPFTYENIDEGRAKEVLGMIADRHGIENAIDTLLAGVPVEDIVV